MEKRNHIRKHIRKLNLSGVITTNPFEILEGGRTFYKKLYTSKRVDLNGEDSKGFFENENIPKLSGELKEICEGRVRIEEITEVLKPFKDNKVPGIDGLPAEFYKAFCRVYYRFLIRLKATLPNSANKLQSEFNIDATNLTMFYSLPKFVCLETYLRDFQFKVINYITCTNILLKKMGIVESDLCTFCNLTKEYIEHLFFSCSFSLIFWKDFELCWKKCTNSNINLASQDVIVGISGNNNGFFNYCIILGKSIIYYCRRNNVKPDIQLFKVKLKQKYQTELYLARKNATLDNFNQKWLFNPLALKF